MKAKEIFAGLLIATAIGVYVYDVIILVKPYKSPKPTSMVVIDKMGPVIRKPDVARFIVNDRNPFLAEKQTRVVVSDIKAPPKVPVPTIPREEVNAPRITITGIMWNPTNPVVMLTLPDGSSTMAKTGQLLLGAITIQKINQNNIEILYKNVKFTINK